MPKVQCRKCGNVSELVPGRRCCRSCYNKRLVAWHRANPGKRRAYLAKRQPRTRKVGSIKTEKCRQLGMPFGTAAGRLRKIVLFNLVQRLGLDTCHRCGQLIVTPDDLSMDHKVDWLNADPALFWDIDNIAFSHRRCNRKRMVTL